jgi:dTDP-4-amino-4,6-dideoxygalactose transaminase
MNYSVTNYSTGNIVKIADLKKGELREMKNLNRNKDLEMFQGNSDEVVLFHPHIPRGAKFKINEVLNSRWIGQGPRVKEFESKFSDKFAKNQKAIAVGSGTDALHLSYILAGLKSGDEVITTIFTCTATNIPFLYMGVKPVFVDIQKHTLNIDPSKIESEITNKTKAIVVVHYGGFPCDMVEINAIAEKYNIPVIQDSAHALGASYNGKPITEFSDFSMFSFQAIKHLTTGDGGMITLNSESLSKKAERLRWFGIDREGKQSGIWENDITEVGYKYQMTDLSAAIGLAGLEEIDETLDYRKKLFTIYENELSNFADVSIVGKSRPDRTHAAWMFTILVKDRKALQQKLRTFKIESNQVHFRNDMYSIFEKDNREFPVMDELEDDYLVLPLHTKVKFEDILRITDIIKTGW